MASLRLSFDYYRDAGDSSAAVAVALHPLRGEVSGVAELCADALALTRSESVEAGRLLAAQGAAVALAGKDEARGLGLLEEALGIARQRGDAALELKVLREWVEVDWMYNRWDEALARSRRCCVARPETLAVAG